MCIVQFDAHRENEGNKCSAPLFNLQERNTWASESYGNLRPCFADTWFYYS